MLAIHWKSVAWLWIWQLALVLIYVMVSLLLAEQTMLRSFVVGLVAVVTLIYQIAMAACLVHLAHEQRPRPLSAVFKESVLIKLPALALVSFVVGAVTFAATLAFVVPGILVAVFWSMAFMVAVVEATPLRLSLQRSVALVRGWWWPVFSRFLFLFTVLTVQAMVGFVPVVGSLVSSVFSFVLVPVTVFYMYLTYKELIDVKQFKHLQAAQMHLGGKFLLACWALLIFTVFVVTSVVLDLVAAAVVINPRFSADAPGVNSVLESTESLVAPIVK